MLENNPFTFADTLGLKASVSRSASSFSSTRSSRFDGIKKVKQPRVRSGLHTTLLLWYVTTEKSMGGGMGGPVGSSTNPSKT